MNQDKQHLILIYDGDCVLCRNCAQAIKLKESIGHFEMIDARSNNKLVEKVRNKGFDLNRGMVVIYGNRYYHGKDALHLLALLTSSSGVFNKALGFLFKSKCMATLCYRPMTWFRLILLKVRGINKIQVKPIHNLMDAIDTHVTPQLAAVLRRRYEHSMVLNGQLIIKFSKLYRFVLPIIRALKALVYHSGSNIPVKVILKKIPQVAGTKMERIFYFSKHDSHNFVSTIYHLKDHYFIEQTHTGITWKFAMIYDQDTLYMRHCCYGLYIKKRFIPLPGFALLIGKPEAFEKPIDENSFAMGLKISHIFSKKFMTYDGAFTIES